MKNFLIAFGFLFLTIVSCENDDFCAEEPTPRLIISFYDKDDPETHKELPIFVWADKKDSIYKLKIVDSILVPLNTGSNSVIYKLSTTNIVDQLDLSYITEDIFVSESCGYKSIFKNLTIDASTNNWISSIEVSNSTIENETTAHVKVYH
jgi:hypothetical protein